MITRALKLGNFSEWSEKSLKVTMRAKRWPTPPKAPVYDRGRETVITYDGGRGKSILREEPGF